MVQGEAQKKYKEANVVRVTVDFNKRTEQPLIDKLKEQEHKATYIKQLIRDDIERGGSK